MTARVYRWAWRDHGQADQRGFRIKGTRMAETWVSADDAWDVCAALADFIDEDSAQ